MSTLRAAVVPSRLGILTLVASDAGLRGVAFDRDRWPAAPRARVAAERVPLDDDVVLARAADELARYLDGELDRFTVSVDLAAAGEFGGAVLRTLCDVPYGGVTTYGTLARAVGRPAAARAVGGACNRNPLPIVVPCHRVIAADGSLGGYAIGLEVKRVLLGIERGVAVPPGGWEPAALARATATRLPDPGAPTLF
jgi:methylated-DNA-[protein]-cysteine S-methyltransferase